MSIPDYARHLIGLAGSPADRALDSLADDRRLQNEADDRLAARTPDDWFTTCADLATPEGVKPGFTYQPRTVQLPLGCRHYTTQLFASSYDVFDLLGVGENEAWVETAVWMGPEDARHLHRSKRKPAPGGAEIIVFPPAGIDAPDTRACRVCEGRGVVQHPAREPFQDPHEQDCGPCYGTGRRSRPVIADLGVSGDALVLLTRNGRDAAEVMKEPAACATVLDASILDRGIDP